MLDLKVDTICIFGALGYYGFCIYFRGKVGFLGHGEGPHE